jgi:hypothetical protein
MAQFEMIGTQAISLQGGRVIPPSSGAFDADEQEMPEHLLAWFEKIGAVRKSQLFAPSPAPDPITDTPVRRRRPVPEPDDEKKE